jgi:Tol biopolymer transport system component
LVDARNGELHEIRTEVEDNASRSFTWSPDGRYIAIITSLLTDPDHPGIIIYDLKSYNAIDLCPMRKLDQWDYDQVDLNLYPPGLVWSPDSRYLVFGQGKDALSEDNRISMLDIYTGEVTLLKEGLGIRFISWSPYDWTKPEK